MATSTDDTSKQLHLGSRSIGRLLVEYSVPAIIASLATSLYNIVDSIFIGRGVGPMAISGLAITFPLMNIVIAFCLCFSFWIWAAGAWWSWGETLWGSAPVP